MPKTALPAPYPSLDLVAAYRNTEFRVFTNPDISLRIGGPAPAMTAFLHANNVTTGFIISAHNPFSRKVLSVAENGERTAHLQKFIRGLGRAAIRAEGRPLAGAWPAEESFLVMGPDRFMAKLMMVLFEQHAVVWCSTTAVPELVFCPPLS